MRIVQAVFGVFHHFELARELERRGHLDRIYSTWPWARLKREGLPHSKVRTFPWIHTPEYLLARSNVDWPRVADHLGYANALAFDFWTSRRIPPCDAFVAISGAGLSTGALVQDRGGIFVCDRGSTHQRYQEQIVSEEYARWGVRREVSDPRDTLREEAIYAQADAITVPSQAARRSFLEMGVPADKVHVIPYGVRLQNFFPVAEPSADEFRLLFAGSVGLRKGVPYLLRAFAELKHPRKTLRIAGAVEPTLKPLLAALPTAGVEFLGSVPQERLRELMSESDALVLPSIEEGLALVQAQAMACACPVVASVNTGAEDLFRDGMEGFIVPVRETASLTSRLQTLANDPALRRSMRAAALARVQTLGGWTDYGQRWEELLVELSGKRAALPRA